MSNHQSLKYFISLNSDKIPQGVKKINSDTAIRPIGLFCAVKSAYFYLEIKKDKCYEGNLFFFCV